MSNPFYIAEEINRLKARMEKAKRRIAAGKKNRVEKSRGAVDEQELYDRLAIALKSLETGRWPD